MQENPMISSSPSKRSAHSSTDSETRPPSTGRLQTRSQQQRTVETSKVSSVYSSRVEAVSCV